MGVVTRRTIAHKIATFRLSDPDAVNQRHLELCSSAEWAEAVEQWIIPAAVRERPRGFATLTAPSFGRVHDIPDMGPLPLRCSPR